MLDKARGGRERGGEGGRKGEGRREKKGGGDINKQKEMFQSKMQTRKNCWAQNHFSAACTPCHTPSPASPVLPGSVLLA